YETSASTEKLIFLFQHLFAYGHCFFPSPCNHLHQYRSGGSNDNSHNHIFQVALHPIVFTKQVTQCDQTPYPKNTAHHVVKCKLLEIHFYNTRYDRGKCAHYGEKTRKDDGYPTPFFIKL